jgi:hypothetical protein
MRTIALATTLLALATLVGCDARVVGASHLTSLTLVSGMLWATLNLDKVR